MQLYFAAIKAILDGRSEEKQSRRLKIGREERESYREGIDLDLFFFKGIGVVVAIHGLSALVEKNDEIDPQLLQRI